MTFATFWLVADSAACAASAPESALWMSVMSNPVESGGPSIRRGDRRRRCLKRGMRCSGHQLTHDEIGDAEGALASQRIRKRHVRHVEHLLPRAAVENTLFACHGACALAHLTQEVCDEEGLELLGRTTHLRDVVCFARRCDGWFAARRCRVRFSVKPQLIHALLSSPESRKHAAERSDDDQLAFDRADLIECLQNGHQ